METSNGPNRFDLEKALVECRAYVDAIKDFQIEIPGKKVATEDAIIEYEARENIKVLLIEFLFECEAEASKGTHHLIRFLRSKRNYWQAAQAQTIGKANEIIERKYGEEKIQYENQRKRFLDFFHHNYTLIDLLIARITGAPLTDYLQSRLQMFGVAWIISNNRLPDNGNLSSETDKVESDHVIEEDKTILDTRPAVALMLFYLSKIRYFEAGGSTRKQIREKEAPLYGFSPDGLYNEFSEYRDEKKRIRIGSIPHIEKAIELLKKKEWHTAVAYAVADLMNCKSLEDQEAA